MSVRSRTWTWKGIERQAFVVDYVDQGGKRRHKTFRTQKAAKDFSASSRIEVKEGTHVADSASATVAQAGDLWINTAEALGLERTTLEQYRQHLHLHILPLLGRTKLSKLNAPLIRAFADRLRDEGRSGTMVKYIIRSLGGLLSDAQERGLIIRNPVHELRVRRKGRKADTKDRRGSKLKVGVDIPTPDEIKAIIQAATGRWRPFLLTAIFSGLRASELRGLRWQDIDLKRAELHIRQRADKYREIGLPKSEAGERTVPLPPSLISVLREWKLACPNGALDLVFPNGRGNVEFHNNIIHRGLWPIMMAAGVTKPVRDDQGAPRRDAEGKPILEPKYTGLHSLRHFYASWCINRKVEAAWSCRPRSCRTAWGILPSRSRSTPTVISFHAATMQRSWPLRRRLY
jgi:integrase